MVKPMLRTRARKRVRKRTPGGRKVLHFKEGKTSRKECARCGTPLSGVASSTVSGMGKLSKSEKVPSRPYAGALCAGCVERLIRYETRFEVKNANPEYSEMELRRDLTLEKFLPKGWFSSLTSKKQ